MFQSILVPLDGSPLAEQAIGPALVIARGANARLHLLLVHQALPLLGFQNVPWSPDASTDEQYLNAIASEAETGSSVAASAEIVTGEDVAKTICDRARESQIDLIVMTSHGRTGLRRILMGSVARKVLRQCDPPVLLLRPAPSEGPAADFRIEQMLVTVDGSAASHEILADATTLAQTLGARLTLLRIVQPVPMLLVEAAIPMEHIPTTRDETATRELHADVERAVRDLASRMESEHPGVGHVEAHAIIADNVAESILAFARSHAIDLIAMSTHGRGVSRVFLGSVAGAVADECDLPMLLRRSRA